jgi:hypothetical protein
VSNFSLWKLHSSRDVLSINRDPLFKNMGIEDFTLQALSPCIGAAVFAPGLSSQKFQNIGAK